ncbi:MAG TPA: zf-HC2 domain-containing protein, partial [Gemmatimonadaceae bacterium]|nr:zf-HC2 domain-containing protein [Gemmatimonadaceae bacterium]
MCAIQDAGTIELYFYGELAEADRAEVDAHLRRCAHCAAALEELRLIREALASRPVVEGPASGDWTAFIARLDEAVRVQDQTAVVVPFEPRRTSARPSLTGLLATAALLAIVSLSVFMASRAG